ncbi:tetratricopeptide repeat protein [Saccharothrix sp. NPDC042600]|uniref:tetratricopeptide repeat protein n=1 Tax=Saccharothrix TaxID=2071 RepID=UPI00340B5A70|nr:hypothetical protein GCM10017745_50540 [Saccharothrix mutabilis subsp. capreolus]
MGEGGWDDPGLPAQVGIASGGGVVYQAGRDLHVQPAAAPTVVWPVRVGVPPPVVEHYQDRVAPGQVVGEAACVVASGLGGVGKSQLVARHVLPMWRDPAVAVAVWVSARSRVAVVAAFAEAARRVLCERDPHIGNRAADDAAGLFREWLAATDRRWLVVLDDVQDPADLRDLWPPQGRVVVTTRLRDLAPPSRGHQIDLDVFSPDEAVSYLTGALGVAGREALDSVRGLADDLGRLPLALGQAAAFIRDDPLLTVAEYRDRFADRRRKLTDLAPTEDRLPEHQLAVAATWSLSIARADRAGPRGVARTLLELAALLDPAGTPLEVFVSSTVLTRLSRRGRPRPKWPVFPYVREGVDRGTVLTALSRLHRLNLITLRRAGSEGTVAVHALVQRAVRDTLTSRRLHTLAHFAADAIMDARPNTITIDPELTQSLRSAARAVEARTTPALWSPRAHPVLFYIGTSLGEEQQSAAAYAYFRELHRQATTRLGPDHVQTLIARNNSAFSCAEVEDPVTAVGEFEALLSDYVRVLGPVHPHTLVVRNNLASCRGSAGDHKGAVEELAVLLVDYLRVRGPDDDSTLRIRNNLAAHRRDMGDVRGAMEAFEMLLGDRLRVCGPDHPSTLTVRSNLADLRGKLGDPVAAAQEFQVLLADHERVLGPTHPDVLAIRWSLARLRGEAGDPAAAAAELTELLSDHVRLLGPDHRRTVDVRNDLAHWQRESEGARRP